MNGFQDSLEKQIPVKRLRRTPLKRVFSKAHTKKELHMELHKEAPRKIHTETIAKMFLKEDNSNLHTKRVLHTAPRTKVFHIALRKEALHIVPNMWVLHTEALHIILHKGEGFENLSKKLPCKTRRNQKRRQCQF